MLGENSKDLLVFHKKVIDEMWGNMNLQLAISSFLFSVTVVPLRSLSVTNSYCTNREL